jgi:hypothetical protein
LTRAHLQHQVVAQEAVDRDAGPLAQRIALAEAEVRDLDSRIDAMAKAASLVAQRQAAAERLAGLKVQESQHARVTAEAGPALYSPSCSSRTTRKP